MSINMRQEIAMWVLGLLWTGFAFFLLASTNLKDDVGVPFSLIVLLVPASLILFSLRDREKKN
jgi:hypothetical protein